MGNPGIRRRQARVLPAVVATAVSTVLTVLKAVVYLLTGSQAMLASAVDSCGDVLVSGANALVLRAATRPADEGHRFGHGKIENLSALFQAILMAGSAIFVVVKGFRALANPEPLNHPVFGIATALLALGSAFLLSTYLRREGLRHRSPALVADSRHYSTDYLTNFGVLAAFVADLVFSYPPADPIISLLIAGTILKSALEVFLDAAHALMDHEISAGETRAIHEAIARFSPTVRGYHDLMTRQAGSDRFVQCHVEIDATLSFREAHNVIEQVRAAIEGAVDGAQVTLHADPWPEDDDDRATHRPHAPHAGV